MKENVKLSRVETAFEDLSYPVTRDRAASSFEGVRLLLADGEADLGGLIGDCAAEEFVDSTDLFYELNNAMPIEAVGEPGQSDGDA